MPLAAQVGQEAEAGIDIRATISGEGIYSRQLTESPRNGTALDGAFRAVVYPLIKLNRHWWLDGAVQFDSAPFFTEDFSAPGHSVTTQILRASLGYKIRRRRESAHRYADSVWLLRQNFADGGGWCGGRRHRPELGRPRAVREFLDDESA